MKTQIKELRVRIDGLAQLVESLGKPLIIVGNNISPDDISEELLKMWRGAPSNVIKLSNEKPVEHYSFNYNLYECHKSLRLAKAWLGKVLGELGEESPYKNDGKRKEVKDIEPPADKSAKSILSNMTYVEKIDFLREDIKRIINDIKELNNKEMSSKGLLYMMQHIWIISKYQDCALFHLSEARFHLGFELQRIKEQEEKL
jgi:hypothetical protein